MGMVAVIEPEIRQILAQNITKERNMLVAEVFIRW
jgi:hypothetical protein